MESTMDHSCALPGYPLSFSHPIHENCCLQLPLTCCSVSAKAQTHSHEPSATLHTPLLLLSSRKAPKDLHVRAPRQVLKLLFRAGKNHQSLGKQAGDNGACQDQAGHS